MVGSRKEFWKWMLAVGGMYWLAAFVCFGDVLFGGTRMLSAAGLDGEAYFRPLREYGFGEMARGHLVGWNPFSFCGTPFAANIQTALFYPLNWIYLVLPGVVATNWSIVGHLVLAAWLVSAWVFLRTNKVLPAVLAGFVYAGCGGYFSHLHPGHLTVLCAGAWVPLLMLCVDRVVEGERGLGWVLLGGVGAAMPVLAGHPQTAYYAGLMAGIYLLVHTRKADAILRVGGMLMLGAGLSAVQLLPTWALSGVTTRAGGLSEGAAAAYALPVENLVTMVAGHFWGSAGGGDYLGRWFAWETSLFVGVVPVVLGGYAGGMGGRSRRGWGVVLVLLILAGGWLGVHGVLVKWLPGFGMFRATGRIGMLVDLMLAVLAGDGLAALMRREGGPPRWLGWGVAGMGVMALVVAGVLHVGGVWEGIVEKMGATGEVFLSKEVLGSARVLEVSLATATGQFLLVGGICVVMGVLLGGWRRWGGKGWAVGLVVLGVMDLVWAGRIDRSSSVTGLEYPKVWQEALARGGDERVLTVDPEFANEGMVRRFLEAGGYDPIILGRYARYLAVSQEVEPEGVDAMPGIQRKSGLFRALRVSRVFYGSGVGEVEGALPRFVWMHRYEVCGKGEMYRVLGEPGFDVGEKVLLEKEPAPRPEETAGEGTVRVVRDWGDGVEIEADTPGAAILLMTDAYAPGWRVVGVGESAGETDEMVPADLALRGIALAAGRHHLRIEYSTPMLKAGAWVTVLTVLAMGVMGFWRRKG